MRFQLGPWDFQIDTHTRVALSGTRIELERLAKALLDYCEQVSHEPIYITLNVFSETALLSIDSSDDEATGDA